jgi:NAD-dependent deacetylase
MGDTFRGDRLKEGIEELALWISQSKYTVVLTGAGMDTESNSPDFRSKNGWWKSIDPRVVANIDTFYENYQLFHEFYEMRLKLLDEVKPHEGHYILAKLEKRGLIKSIATQNVSGLHAMAGSENVYELHGSIRKIRCNKCGQKAELADFMEGKACPNCGRNALRPDVVLFGEGLPQDAWDASFNDIEKSDLLVVIGTSLEVYPVNQLPLIAKGKSVLINNEDVGRNCNFNLKLIGTAKGILIDLDKKLFKHS